jgi:hypothetical protein
MVTRDPPKREDGMVWIGLIWLRIGIGGGEVLEWLHN